MDTAYFLSLAEGLPYLLVAVVLALLGLPVADKVMTRGIDLKKALFEDDNPVAGLEIGAVFLAILYVSYNAITGPSLDSLGMDVGAAAIAALASILLLVVFRFVLGVLVRSHNKGQDLNHEIFQQRNWAAACVSIVLMMGIVNGMTEENSLGPDPLRDGALALLVMLLGSVGAVFSYRFSHLKGTSFMKEMFSDDNPAAGVSLLGHAFALNAILYALCQEARAEAPLLGAAALFVAAGWLVLVVLLALIRALVFATVGLILGKKGLWDELFEQNNVGVGFIDAATSIGVAFLLLGALVE